MTPTANTSDAASASGDAASTGFILYEKLTAEQRGGKSRTLEQWLSQVRQQLSQVKAQNPAPKVQKDVTAVEHACQLAAELVTDLTQARK